MGTRYQGTSFSGGIPTASALTAAFDQVEEALSRSLSLDGDTPNAMEVDLDLNGHNVINVGRAGGRLITSEDLDPLESDIAELKRDDQAILGSLAGAYAAVDNVSANLQGSINSINQSIFANRVAVDGDIGRLNNRIDDLESIEPSSPGGEGQVSTAQFRPYILNASDFIRDEAPSDQEAQNRLRILGAQPGDCAVYESPRHVDGTAWNRTIWTVVNGQLAIRVTDRLPRFIGTNLRTNQFVAPHTWEFVTATDTLETWESLPDGTPIRVITDAVGGGSSVDSEAVSKIQDDIFALDQQDQAILGSLAGAYAEIGGVSNSLTNELARIAADKTSNDQAISELRDADTILSTRIEQIESSSSVATEINQVAGLQDVLDEISSELSNTLEPAESVDEGDSDKYITGEQGAALDAELNTKVTAMSWASAELLTSSDSSQVSILDMPRAGLFNVVNTDIAAEVLLDPERAYYLPWAGTDGSQGGLVRDLTETPKARFFGVQFSYPHVTLTAAEISALEDLNTPKLQAMINWTAHHRRVKCYMGVGKYHFKKLYLTGDANNPGFPDDNLLQGRIALIGESQGTFVNYRGIGGNGGSVGTHLVSSDPVGPALYGNGDPQDDDRNLTNKVRVESMAIEANNTTYVVDLYRCPQYSGLTDVSIIQRNKDGGGYRQEQKWLTYNHNVVCEYIGANDGTGIPRNTKIGVLVRNSSTTPNSLSGGFNVMDQIMGQRFRVGVMIGGETRGEGLRDHGYTCISVQGGQCDTGILLGQGALNVTMSGTHCEGNVIGYHICSGANRVSINGTTSSNQLDMMLGYGATGIPDVDAVTAAAGHNVDSNSASSLTINMRYDSGPETRKNLAIFSGTKNTRIDRPQFANPSATANPHVEAAIFLEDAVFEGLEIIDPEFSANYPEEIQNEIRGATSNAKQSLALIGDGLSVINTMDVPYAATVYGTNTTNSVYRLISSANVNKPHGYSQTIINSANSTGFYNVQDIATTVVQILPGESAKVIFDKINSAWIIYKI